MYTTSSDMCVCKSNRQLKMESANSLVVSTNSRSAIISTTVNQHAEKKQGTGSLLDSIFHLCIRSCGGPWKVARVNVEWPLRSSPWPSSVHQVRQTSCPPDQSHLRPAKEPMRGRGRGVPPAGPATWPAARRPSPMPVVARVLPAAYAASGFAPTPAP